MHLIGLLRNLAVARLVAPEDFGVAAALAAVLAILEAASDLAWDKLLVQAREGDEAGLQNTLQAMMLARGLMLGAVLGFGGGAVAAVMGVPEAGWAFAALGLVPVLRGAMHLDPKRVQRGMRFGPDLKVGLAGHLAGAAVAVAGAALVGDYRAMLWGILAQAATQVVGSHLAAERAYGLALDRATLMRALRFGWPLMANGLVIVAVAQADRVLIGAASGMEALARYAAAAMLIGAPAVLASQVIRGAGLPWLAARQDRPEAFARAAQGLGSVTAAVAIAVFVPAMLVGADAVRILFGAAYAPEPLLVALLGLGAGIRVIRSWPALTALARADGTTALIGNLVRAVGLGAAVAALWLGLGAAGVAGAIALGEAAGFAAAAARAARRHAMPMGRAAWPVWAAFAALAAGLLWADLAAGCATSLWARAGLAAAATLAGLIACGVAHLLAASASENGSGDGSEELRV